MHQSAADTEGDDDKRAGLRGEGIYTCCFHRQPVASTKVHPCMRQNIANISGYNVSALSASNYWKALAQNALTKL